MIGTVKHNGQWLEIYDENGHCTASIQAKDGLAGYNSTTVSVKNGQWTELYDENGNNTGYV